MIRATLSPLLSGIPFRRKLPIASFPSFRASSTSRSHVCSNASPDFTTSILSPPTSAYIHLPFCRKRCHYCDFTIIALGSSSPKADSAADDDSRISNYVDLLCREIQATKPTNSSHPPLQTIFLGGGTPSLVPPELISVIFNTLRSKLGISSDAEISMEVDPGTFDGRKLIDLRKLGVNRVSVGVQAFQEEMLRGCGRSHGLAEVMEAIEIVQSCGYDNWSMDLISSLPHLTAEIWKESLDMAVRAGPAHISVYDLQVEQGTKFGLWYKPGEYPLPSENQSALFYRTASQLLADAGYNHYEISSYSKSGYECKHNLVYWKNKPFYGFGLGSTSYIGGVRYSRPKKMKQYLDYVHRLEHVLETQQANNALDVKDLAMDVVMLSLRMARGLDVMDFGKTFGDDLLLSLLKTFQPYVESGHVLALDENRRPLSADEFALQISEGGGLMDKLAFLRLSDPDGFLLSNELISIAFGVISP